MSRGLLTMMAVGGAWIAGSPALAQTATPDWTGFYAGVSTGYSFEQGDSDETLVFDTNRDGSFNDTVRTGAGANAFSPGFCDGFARGRTPGEGCKDTEGEGIYSLRAGYDRQFGKWVFGGLAEYSFANLSDDVTGFSTTPASYSFSRDLTSVAALRARGGYVVGPAMVYGTAGAAYGEIDHSFSTTNGANSFTRSDSGDNWGYQVGAGIETHLTPSLVLGAEYLYTSLSDDDYTVAVGPGTAPPTNPFLLVNATGTDMRREKEDFDYGTVNLTLTWRR